MEYRSKIERANDMTLMLGLNQTIDRFVMTMFVGMVMC